jgi:hypothetical protein
MTTANNIFFIKDQKNGTLRIKKRKSDLKLLSGCYLRGDVVGNYTSKQFVLKIIIKNYF